MSASPDPPADADLLRLLDEYADRVYESARLYIAGLPGAHTHPDAARAALLAHVAATYVRRPQTIYPQQPEVGEFFDNVDLGIVQRWNGEQWVPAGRYR